jgi:hypothetical protein
VFKILNRYRYDRGVPVSLSHKQQVSDKEGFLKYGLL